MSKYLAKKTIVDGIKFDSQREAKYYLIYKQMEKQGTITDLKLQVPFDFKINNKKIFTYKADFTYRDTDGLHIIDVKSKMSAKLSTYRLKKKIIENYYNIIIEERY